MCRVLNVVGDIPTGGVESVLKNYQTHLTDNIVFDYLFFSDKRKGQFDKFVQGMGSRVYFLPALKNTRLIQLCMELDGLFRRIAPKYDIVHIHSVNIVFLVSKYAKKYGIKRIVAHGHATKYSDNWLKSIRNRILCTKLTKQSSHLIACSELAGNFLFGNEKVNSGEVKIIKNAIDIDKFSFSENLRTDFRKEFGITDQLVMTNIGRLAAQKNQLFLIDIFYEFNQIVPNSILFIIGEGELKQKLLLKTNKLNLSSKVKFIDKRSDIPTVLSGSDIFVLPSLFEGLPVAGIEALASGLPCFFSDTITQEFKTNNAHYYSLDMPALNWAQNMLNALKEKSLKRDNSELRERGYDIKEQVTILEDFYKKMLIKI